MGAPDCRECGGSGQMLDIPHHGESADCPRCGGLGVERCGECLVTDPHRLVVAEYHDQGQINGALVPYDSQVCEACARRLCGLIEEYSTAAELEETCAWCGYAEKGAGWGYLQGPRWSGRPDYCVHFTAMRECTSCTSRWWTPGLESKWDIDGAAHEDCPECVAATWDPEDLAHAQLVVEAQRADRAKAVRACS